ncbi:MAG TPA: type IV pilus modification protein PilV [Burkholderiales bacterium]|nr:type IV pilus modification protein PilV [Burkholderiales bacterium]
MRTRPMRSPTRLRGVTMIEVLVTIVILTFGLLGVVALQARMQVAQSESYHRSQAILLMQDIVDRVNANRSNALNYVTAAPLGTGNSIQDCTGLAGAALDLCEWNNALLGATESTAGGQSAGAMIGARGCIMNVVATMPREFLVAVTWQGLVPTIAPASTTCGQGLYGNDQMRRALVARVMIGCLQNDPTTGLCVTP